MKKLFLLVLLLTCFSISVFASPTQEASQNNHGSTDTLQDKTPIIQPSKGFQDQKDIVLHGNKNYLYAFTDGNTIVYVDQTSASLQSYSDIGITFAILEIKLAKKDKEGFSVTGQRVVHFFKPFNGDHTTAYIRDNENEDPIWKAFDISDQSKENEYARKPFLIAYQLIMKKPYKYQ